VNVDKPPKLLSVEFHTRFFPALLWRRYRPAHQARSGFFSSSFVRDLAVTGCIVLVAIGFPTALSRGILAGWIAGGIGAAGILAMLVHSIASRRGEPPSWDGFLVGFFFFFLTAGLSTGILFSTLDHYLLVHGLLACAAGLIAGYVLGILAGFVMQYLGWLASILDQIVVLAILGLLVLDLVLLSGASSR
jgi:hypothetical protein